jgi:hypothetical protein
MRLMMLVGAHSLPMCAWASTVVWEIVQAKGAADRERTRVSPHLDVVFSVLCRAQTALEIWMRQKGDRFVREVCACHAMVSLDQCRS